jgi:hypothetical protein
MTRTLPAALLGGIAMFLWSYIAHDLLPLGRIGVAEIPNEAAVLGTMQNNIREGEGLYIFPGFGLGPGATREQEQESMKHMNEKLASNPSGILVYHPAGARPIKMGQFLSVEFITEFIEALLAVLLLSRTSLTSYGARVGFIVVVGAIAAISTDVPYWNWYGFPGNYTLSQILMKIVGFLLVGLIAGLILRKKPAAAKA